MLDIPVDLGARSHRIQISMSDDLDVDRNGNVQMSDRGDGLQMNL